MRSKEGRAARNHPLIAGRTMLGKGFFAAAFEGQSSDWIYKITLDYAHHAIAFVPDLIIDTPHVPKVLKNHGEIGRQRDKPIFLTEVERLTPVPHTKHRHLVGLVRKMHRFHRDWLWERAAKRRRNNNYRLYDRLALGAMLEQPFLPEELETTIERMIEVVAFGDFVIDMKESNFMVRESTGELVLNDVMSDGWHVSSNPMAYA